MLPIVIFQYFLLFLFRHGSGCKSLMSPPMLAQRLEG